MQITLELTQPRVALLRALSPREAGASKIEHPLESTALRILTSGMTREASMRRINTENAGRCRQSPEGTLKLEIDLNQNQHALLLEIASRDRTHRSLSSIARGFMVDGLMGGVTKMCAGNRPKAIASLVAAGNGTRRKS